MADGTSAAPSAYLARLASFTPDIVLRDARAGGRPLTEAKAERIEAAALFVDVAGFTALTETLAKRGAAGAEDLTRLLNAYFSRLIDAVMDRGGDIVKFAGDAIVAIWPSDAEEPLARAVRRAALCALDVATRLNDFEVAEGFRLRVKLVVGAGELTASRLGGVFDRWELLIAGDALRQLGLAGDHARPGDAILSTEARALLGDDAAGEEAPDGALRLHALAGAEPPPKASPAPPTPASAAAMRAFVPAAARTRLELGEMGWLGELRPLSVLFVNLPDFGVETPLDQAQAAMRAMQLALYRFEGSINKMSVDDKGASLVAAFGLPPLAHADDPERAVRAAITLREGLEALGLHAWIGVTTGSAFCGVVGSERRREYTIMGDIVNLSARLMAAAKGGKTGPAVEGGMLVDAPTRAAARRLRFETLEPVMVKGKADPVEIFRPLAPETRIEAVPADARRAVRIVGRAEERAKLKSFVARLAETGAPARLLLLGEGGLGKSRLLQEAARLAGEAGAAALVGGGDPIEAHTPYRAWRTVFAALLDDPSAPDDDARCAAALARLPAEAEAVRDAPLLEAVLPWGWRDNEATANLSGPARAARTRALLLRLLRAAATKPLLLVLRDAQWMDSASLALLRAAADLDAPIGLLVSARSAEAAEDAGDWAEFLAMPGLGRIELGPLDPAAMAELVRRRLGAKRVAPALSDFLVERAEGNPLYAEELALSLRESGVVEVAEGEARIAAGREDPSGWRLPATMEGLIAARIDRLKPDEQVTMKAASVIGRVFEEDALARVHPEEHEVAALHRHCEALARLELTPPVKTGSILGLPPTRSAWKFKSSLLKDVAYGRMLFSQRRELHRRMAEWIEIAAGADPEAAAPLLAFHWGRAAEDQAPEPAAAMKAVGAGRTAARRAQRLHALREAIDFFGQALTLLRRLPESPERDREELSLLLELGPCLVAARSFSAPEVKECFDRARALSAATGERRPLFDALRGLWQVRVGEGKYARARDLAEEAARLAQAEGDPSLEAEAQRLAGFGAFWEGAFADAAERLEAAAALGSRTEDPFLARRWGQDPAVAAGAVGAWALAELDRGEAARDAAERARSRAAAIDHPFSLAYAEGGRMWTAWRLGDRAMAAEAGRLCRDLSLERGFPYLAFAARVVVAWGEGAGSAAATACEEWRRIGGGIGLPIFLLVLAELRLEAGDGGGALATLADPVFAALKAESWLRARFHAVRAAALAATGAPEAEAALAAARDEAAAQGAKRLLAELR